MKQSYLLSIVVNFDTKDWNTDYVITVEEVLGRSPEVGDEILLEVEFKDGLIDLSVMNFCLSVGLTEISSNIFEDCTEATNFSYAFDTSTFSKMGIQYENPLKSPCPIDKDGTPIYNRSGSGKNGYAIVTSNDGCFQGCSNMNDYNTIPFEWGGKYYDPSLYKIIIEAEYIPNANPITTSCFSERLENGEYINYYFDSETNNTYVFKDATYGFRIQDKAGASAYQSATVTKITFNNYSTTKVTDMSLMFNICSSLTNLDLSSFYTSNVTKISYMFINCLSLVSLDLSNFDTSNVINKEDSIGMFIDCNSLSHIKCKQAFKDWCITNKNNINLPSTMVNGTVGPDSSYNWEIIDLQ